MILAAFSLIAFSNLSFADSLEEFFQRVEEVIVSDNKEAYESLFYWPEGTTELNKDIALFFFQDRYRFVLDEGELTEFKIELLEDGEHYERIKREAGEQDLELTGLGEIQLLVLTEEGYPRYRNFFMPVIKHDEQYLLYFHALHRQGNETFQHPDANHGEGVAGITQPEVVLERIRTAIETGNPNVVYPLIEPSLGPNGFWEDLYAYFLALNKLLDSVPFDVSWEGLQIEDSGMIQLLPEDEEKGVTGANHWINLGSNNFNRLHNEPSFSGRIIEVTPFPSAVAVISRTDPETAFLMPFVLYLGVDEKGHYKFPTYRYREE